MSEFRPNPDQLLESISKASVQLKRGKLKVFFGMCPGVGKTFAMLKAAHERQASGVTPLIGIVETHARAETENLLEGLKRLPLRKFEYKGAQVEEFDLDQALLMKPELLLVDELAHTNAVGSRHAKRYQDVEELLNAGIDVYTTINVQHIESRMDSVQQITGVAVRESVPDQFLGKANEIEIIDISPEQLLKRLREGKVYAGDRAVRAENNFFKEGTLIALRELALRFTAEIVDDKLRDHMSLKGIAGPWNTNERLMVAVSQSPLSERLIRATRRMAYNLEAPWVALYVDTGRAMSSADEINLKKNLDMARSLGAEVVIHPHTSVRDALLQIAREKNATQIVMGRPDRRLLQDLRAGGTLLDQLVNEESDIDVHVIRQKTRPRQVGFHLKLPVLTSKLSVYLKTLFYCAMVASLNYLALPYLGYRAMGFVFLISVLPVALLSSFGPTLFTAGVSALVWDFCFIPPQFTFEVREFQDAMMILTYFAVALAAGFLAQRLRMKELDLVQRESRTRSLYEFERKLAAANTLPEIARYSAETIDQIFSIKLRILAVMNEKLTEVNQVGESVALSEKDRAVAEWSLKNRAQAGRGTQTLFSADCLCYPLLGRNSAVGVLILYPEKILRPDQESLLTTIAANLALAVERQSLEASSTRALILEQSEKMHQTLLNSVSHELRTPLTSIMGIASAFAEDGAVESAEYRQSLVRNLSESAHRLQRTVENILDMTRLSTGVLAIKHDYFELGDFLSSWVNRSEPYFQTHPIRLKIESAEALVKGDEKLLDSVMTNLVLNASNYSSAGQEIEISLTTRGNFAEIKVMDQGPGISREDLPHLFERFFKGSVNSKGLGLGLSIVKAVVEGHGGEINAANRLGRNGAEFTVSLPFEPLPKEVGA